MRWCEGNETTTKNFVSKDRHVFTKLKEDNKTQENCSFALLFDIVFALVFFVHPSFGRIGSIKPRAIYFVTLELNFITWYTIFHYLCFESIKSFNRNEKKKHTHTHRENARVSWHKIVIGFGSHWSFCSQVVGFIIWYSQFLL